MNQKFLNILSKRLPKGIYFPLKAGFEFNFQITIDLTFGKWNNNYSTGDYGLFCSCQFLFVCLILPLNLLSIFTQSGQYIIRY